MDKESLLWIVGMIVAIIAFPIIKDKHDKFTKNKK